ncbi:MAG: DNA polymerase III subunit alpha, partial [Bacteroidota bacterium]
LKSADEMRAAFPGLTQQVLDEALDSTMEVASKCDVEFEFGKLLMPNYPIPERFGGDMDAYLRHMVYERAATRYPVLSPQVRERLDLELGIIATMGYAGYFLIVQDFTTAARDLGVRVGPGRGSAAGSAVAFCLGITNIDPLHYDLLFERFLNPERVSMPDIDIDFDDRGRGKVIDYVVDKYGRENVCQIITFGTMGARSVIRDVARVLNIPLAEADRIAKLIPEGPKENLTTARSKVKEFKDLFKSPDRQISNLMHYATVLEGSARHTGIHAAGVIIAPGDVSEYVPVSVQKSKSGGKDEQVVVTQYDGKYIEDFGLLKMDFLGLKTLTILEDALALINTHHGVDIDLDAIPLDDEATYKLFQHGDTVSVFQFESSGMREWMRKLKPTTLDDLIAMNALYRPGPMDLIPNYIDRKHGRETVDYPHPMLEDILRPTYGIPVYQEQVMQMAQTMGGYSLGGADLLRRAMGKKKQSEMDKQRVIFVEGAKARDVPEEKANEVFDMMAKFAGYGFNKSHSAAYSVVAYQTAYLKAHYPAEYMAAAMTSEMNDTKKLAIILEEARKMGIEIRPPSVLKSRAHFNVDEGTIRFGLAAVKGAGHGAIEAILSVSERKGIESLFQLCCDVDFRAVNKKALESLIRAGAFDELEGHRAQLLEALDGAVRYGQKTQADKAAGQNSLFGPAGGDGALMEPNLPFVDSWTKAERLRNERELMGFYVSGHPLDQYTPEVRAFTSASLGNPDNIDFARPHAFCGIITEVVRRTTKSGRPMAFFTIEDFQGQGEVVCFSTQYEKFSMYINVDELVMVKGQVEERGGQIKIKPTEILPMQKVRDKLVRSITLTIDTSRHDIDTLRELYRLCQRNQGQCRLYFDVFDTQLPNPVKLRSRSFVVDPSPELMQGIVRLFGPEYVTLKSD